MSEDSSRQRKIIHVDMDCFYAAVEMRDRPEFKGKPLGVGGSPKGRGVIATANYEARKFGVRSAMSTARAMSLCPQLILIPPNFSKYRAVSLQVREIFERFTLRVEPLSLDEAYLDVSDSPHFEGRATDIAREIRSLIEGETGLTASAGVAPNKFLAKIASEWNKPNGLKVIRPHEVAAIMPSLKIEKIFGVGKVTAEKMHKLGIHTCGDIQKLSIEELRARFGSWGVRLRDYAFGLDTREVSTSRVRKSLSVERTYSSDLQDLGVCREKLREIYDRWLERLHQSGMRDKIRSAVLKLKFHDFTQTTHEELVQEIPSLAAFDRLLQAAFERRAVPVRLIGLGVRFDADSSPRTDRAQLSLL